jgi:hypothetical protein
MWSIVLAAELSVVVGVSQRGVRRSDRVEGVATTKVHSLEAMLDLVGHLGHVSVGQLQSAYGECDCLICKAARIVLTVDISTFEALAQAALEAQADRSHRVRLG